MVVTNLGRVGGPAIRYRTGDIVRGYRKHDHPCKFLWLRGGVFGRADDMIVVRGVNIFPSSIEAIVRELEPTDRIPNHLRRQNEMDQLELEIETDPSGSERLTGYTARSTGNASSGRTVPGITAKIRGESTTIGRSTIGRRQSGCLEPGR